MQLKTIIVAGPREGTGIQIVAPALSQIHHIIEFNHICVGSFKGTDYEVVHAALKAEMLVSIDTAWWLTGEKGGPPEGPTRNMRMFETWTAINSLQGVFGFPSSGPGTNGMLGIGQTGCVPTYQYDLRILQWVEI